jgi:uroporphyrinogen-III synthase
MLQNNMHILCTRPLDQPLIEKAARKNIYIDVVPFIETAPLLDDETLQQVKTFSLDPIVAVFTSVNAVEAVIAQFSLLKPSWQIFCMGGATKQLVYDFFGEASVTGTARNASLLAEKIISHKTVKEVVFFCGEQRMDDLPETLQRHGITVKEVPVYTTIQTPVAIEKNYDGVIFFSPSAVHSFFSLNTVPVEVVLFAIGKTTTATIQTYCTNKVVTSEWPGKEQMVDLAIQYFTEKSSNASA